MSLDLAILSAIKTPAFAPHMAFSLYARDVHAPAHLLQYAAINHPDAAPIQHQKLYFVPPAFPALFEAQYTAILHGSDVVLVMGYTAAVCLPRGKTSVKLHESTTCKLVPVHGPTKVKVRSYAGELIFSGILDFAGYIIDVSADRFEIELDKECFIALPI